MGPQAKGIDLCLESWARLWTADLVPQDEEKCAKEGRKSRLQRSAGQVEAAELTAFLQNSTEPCVVAARGWEDRDRGWKGGSQGCILRAMDGEILKRVLLKKTC